MAFGRSPCSVDLDCPSNEVCYYADLSWTGGNSSCGCDLRRAVLRDEVTGKCAIPSAGAYFMVSDSCLQMLFGLAACGFGLRILQRMRRLSKSDAAAVTRVEWGCMWSCCLSGIFLFLSRLFVVLKFITPSLFISCCDRFIDPVSGFREEKTHIFRIPCTLLLYISVGCSGVAIHSVAYIFVTHAMKTGRFRRDTSSIAGAFRLYLKISIFLFLTAAVVVNLINVGYVGIVTALSCISACAMFRFAEVIFVRPMCRVHERGASHDRALPLAPELQRMDMLLRQIRMTIRWIEAASFAIFILSCAFVFTHLLGGSYREVARPGSVSLSEIANSWLGGSYILYIFAVEWFLNYVFQRMDTDYNDFTQTPASLSGSSSTLMTRAANSMDVTF